MAKVSLCLSLSQNVNNCNAQIRIPTVDLSFVVLLGVYFAKHASYANKYSRSSKDPLPLYGVETQIVQEATKIIFLARVVIGKSIVGHKNFLKPDNGSMENPHQSCVDDSNNPTIFVLFDPNQIYPEYLIQYSD